ncbi:Hypothetical_protein [Hexamita inflata]|uniref:Hypothetical_protein n=1 Tax=Hexamita inflata TaxID=28002 RepID=A0ABP1IZR8_9EUKA
MRNQILKQKQVIIYALNSFANALDLNVTDHSRLKQFYKQIEQKKQIQKRGQTVEECSEIYNYALGLIGVNCCSHQELARTINEMNQKDQQMFWKYVSAHTRLTIITLKQFFIRTYMKVLHSDHVNEQDKKFILQYCKQNNNYSVTEITNQLLKEQFSKRDIYFWDLYKVIVCIARLLTEKYNYSFKNMQKYNEHNKYLTQLYKLGLTKVISNEDHSNLTQKQICDQINTLNFQYKYLTRSSFNSFRLYLIPHAWLELPFCAYLCNCVTQLKSIISVTVLLELIRLGDLVLW